MPVTRAVVIAAVVIVRRGANSVAVAAVVTVGPGAKVVVVVAASAATGVRPAITTDQH